MPVEGPITDISDLNEAWPLDSDLQQQTDEHLRLTKDAIKKTFTDLSANGGAVTATAAEMNHLQGVKSNVQAQIDTLEPPWVFVDTPTFTAVVDQPIYYDPPAGGLTITLPEAPPNGSEVLCMDVAGTAGSPGTAVTVNVSGADTMTFIDVPDSSGETTFTATADNHVFTLIYFDQVWYLFFSATQR